MLSEEQLEKIANQGPVDIGGAQNPIVTEMAAELLSLREQLAELKVLPPVAEVVSKFGDPEAFGERELNILADIQKMPYGTQLFTAAKSEALPRHIFSMLVNELRDVPAIGCKRELIIGVLNRHGVIADSVEN
ncbi:TPA: hypothetical protein ACGATF_004161 [Yersinia enterocolitica]|uniref:hypothetical protein n=1 Tax=Yersinia sp. LJYL362 TaxID=3402108 RepID=UPI0036D66643